MRGNQLLLSKMCQTWTTSRCVKPTSPCVCRICPASPGEQDRSGRSGLVGSEGQRPKTDGLKTESFFVKLTCHVGKEDLELLHNFIRYFCSICNLSSDLEVLHHQQAFE